MLSMSSSTYRLLLSLFSDRNFVWSVHTWAAIATGYGPNSPEIESRCGARLFACVQTGSWGPPSLLYTWYRVIPWGKLAKGGSVDHPPVIQRRGRRKNRAIPLLPLWTITTCFKMIFTFTLLCKYILLCQWNSSFSVTVNVIMAINKSN